MYWRKTISIAPTKSAIVRLSSPITSRIRRTSGTQSAFSQVSGMSASTGMLLDMGMAFAFMHLFMDFLIRRVNYAITDKIKNIGDDDDDYFDDDDDPN